VVLTIRKTLRIFFKYRRRLLGELGRAAMVRYYGLYANAQIHPSPGVDVRGREAAAGSCLRTEGPDGGRGARGIRVEAPGRGERPALVKPHSGLTNLISRPPAAGSAQSQEIDICPGRGYPPGFLAEHEKEFPIIAGQDHSCRSVWAGLTRPALAT
jgi:hypothetical protein